MDHDGDRGRKKKRKKIGIEAKNISQERVGNNLRATDSCPVLYNFFCNSEQAAGHTALNIRLVYISGKTVLSVAKKTLLETARRAGRKCRTPPHSFPPVSDDPKYFLAEPRTELRKNFKVAFLLRVIFFALLHSDRPPLSPPRPFMLQDILHPPPRIFQRRTRFRRDFSFLFFSRFEAAANSGM